nr:winged helix-turn-helix domain-containing protein [Candidatus Freyarchaeota archaeon]
MTPGRKFTDNNLRQLHSQGLTVREIAERLGVSEATVLRHARRLELTLKRKRSDEQLSREESKDVSEKRAKGDKSSFLPPPSGGWPM